jgi:hypothetical protein
MAFDYTVVRVVENNVGDIGDGVAHDFASDPISKQREEMQIVTFQQRLNLSKS